MRYQIIFKGRDDGRPIQNFETKRELDAAVKELREEGAEFAVWDTRKNPISDRMKW